MRRAVIYARVSLDKTGEGASVERQLEACRALAVARGWDVVDEKVDNSISAWSNKRRPAWESVLEMVDRREVEVIVAWHLDRVTRSMKELERLIALSVERGVGVATATGDIDLTTDTGRMVARILAAVAAAEVERKGARQRLANAQRAAKGVKTYGHRPFGWTADQSELVEEEAALLRKAADDVIAGVPLGTVAREWREAGVPTAQGGEWKAVNIRAILLNPRMVGARVYKGDVVAESAFPAVLSESKYMALRAVLTAPGRHVSGHTGRTPTTLLTGIARCSVCDGAMYASPAREKPKQAPGYTCLKGCARVNREPMDLYIETIVVERLSKPDLLMKRDQGGDIDALLRERMELQKRMEGLATGFANGLLSYEQMVAGTDTLRRGLRALEERLGALTAISGFEEFTGAHSNADTQGRWDNLTLGRKRKVIESLFDRIIVSPPGRGFRGGFKPECVTYVWANDERPPAELTA
jgi:site-specific DNA recombinase